MSNRSRADARLRDYNGWGNCHPAKKTDAIEHIPESYFPGFK
jgi:hypothetical protein